MSNDNAKQNAAIAAIEYIPKNAVIGVGTGSTVNLFIDELAKIKHKIEGAVASSQQSIDRLKLHNIPIIEPNSVSHIPIYVDGADEINEHFYMIKGGGGALTGEKIIAAMSAKFICIADESKLVKVLGKFPVAVEVIPMARSYVARSIVKMGGDPEYRDGFVSDHGNIILDIYNLDLVDPPKMEAELNQIPGVVCNGIFAKTGADILLLGNAKSVETRKK